MFDSHAHLGYFPREEVPLILERAKAAGVKAIMDVATNNDALERSLLLPELPVTILRAAATTPHEIQETDPFFSVVEKEAVAGRLSAIGEIGLEFFHQNTPKERQLHSFFQYADLAKRTKLSLIIHCRDAFDVLIPLLKEMDVRGVIHCFTGSLHDAKLLLDLGWHLSFSGIVTYPKSHLLREVVEAVPIDRMLVETDAPFLPPQPFRGKQNESAYLLHTVQTVASVKQLPVEEVIQITFSNASRLFLAA
jgi:TatD DNase family protein